MFNFLLCQYRLGNISNDNLYRLIDIYITAEQYQAIVNMK